MSEAQLAYIAIAAAPVIVGALFALGDLCVQAAARRPPPSPTRVARLCLAGPFIGSAFAIAVALELVDDLVVGLHAGARRAVIALRAWVAA
ncbi:hypothetical protein ASF58_23335 [Methylobacterium sp. Leaf125]|uniref:hypothetical protein n=1 Tax=Methylobacterium sp. Leaf125 TaxID=1736265 RepID=UPI0006F7777C|nr:hypothetical protein [Methylobacterium sp. Leaf125]KQQ39077.1 hypothetical protein ASF58_23335 [Methylobacterium sp. Leaf125]